MQPIRMAAAAALLLSAAFSAPGQTSIFGSGAAAPKQTPPEDNSTAPPLEDVPADPVEAALAGLDLRSRISQLMCVTMEGVNAPSLEDLAFLKNYTPGAALIRHAPKPDTAMAYAAKVRGIEQHTGIPMLAGANLYLLAERDRNLQSGFVQLPTKLAVAAANDEDATRDLGKLIARQMRAMGFNFYLGPSLELSPSLPEAKGSIHSLGGDPAFTAAAGNILMECLRAEGVLPLPMGFPGGGANRRDGSKAVLTTPRNLLPQAELLPYIRAIEAGAPILHVGNTLTPTLSAGVRAASQSPGVMRELLRDELGYTGVIAAGPMDGGDLVDGIAPAEAAITALESGADMLLWGRADTMVMATIERIREAVESGRLSESLINAAAGRILRLKYAHAAEAASLGKLDFDFKNTKRLEELTYNIERRALTLVRNRGQVLPMRKENAMPVFVTGVVGAEELRDALQKYMKPIPHRPIATALKLGRIEDFEVDRILRAVGGFRTAVCIFTDAIEARGAVELVRGLRGAGAHVVVLLFGYPELVPQLADADAILLAYCDSATFGQTLRAAARVLAGEGPLCIPAVSSDLPARVGEERAFDAREAVCAPAGRLPVTLSDEFPAGLMIPYNPEYAIGKAEWDFGDGGKSKSERATHAYKAPGRYPLTLKITDQEKQSTTQTFHVVVE